MPERIKSRRGVYYDLSKSPHEFKTPYGDLLKFSSAKKLEIYTRDIPNELARLEKLVERHDLKNFIPAEIYQLLMRSVYMALYRKTEG